MKHLKFFAALCCVAAAFAACDPDPEQFYVMVAANDEVMGTVQVNGTSSYFTSYSAGAQINIMATPNTGCYFQQWDDGNTDNPRTITVTADVAYTAIFAANPNGNESGHEWVDLGLSVKWATCNVGATTPEEYGNYYAWGETTPKDYYARSNYKWYYKGSATTLTKYNTSSSNGTVDNKTVLELADDAAHANWGGQWRMPTNEEWTELCDNCEWTWTTCNGVRGSKGKSKINGNSIFLPAAGYRYSNSRENACYYGYYWSSSLDMDNSHRACYASICLIVSGSYYGSREDGLSVRPVCE